MKNRIVKVTPAQHAHARKVAATGNEVRQAIAALALPSPTALDVSLRRLRGMKARRKRS